MYSFGIIMDSIEKINPETDSTISITSALQEKCNIEYIKPGTIHLYKNKVFAKSSKLKIYKNKNKFFQLKRFRLLDLSKLDAIFFRIDPPVNDYYIQLTYLLDYLEENGVMVINSPQSIRDFNEKLLGSKLTQNQVPTLMTSNKSLIMNFIKTHKKVVIKPLNMMGGKDIYLINELDKNKSDIIKKSTTNYSKNIIVQKYLKEVKNGDTRILIYNGKVYKKVLVRYPPKNDLKANLVYGGKYIVKNINNKHLSHLKNVAIFLKSQRVYFAGVDMIGDNITEINITSPTGVKQIESKNIGLSKLIADEFIMLLDRYYNDKA